MLYAMHEDYGNLAKPAMVIHINAVHDGIHFGGDIELDEEELNDLVYVSAACKMPPIKYIEVLLTLAIEKEIQITLG